MSSKSSYALGENPVLPRRRKSACHNDEVDQHHHKYAELLYRRNYYDAYDYVISGINSINLTLSCNLMQNLLLKAANSQTYLEEHNIICKTFKDEFRPISLLPNIEKILEKLMYNRDYNFFTKNNLIYPLQFGFRQQYSLFLALVSLTEDSRKSLDNGIIGCGIGYFC